jgi:hypothetical protein
MGIEFEYLSIVSIQYIYPPFSEYTICPHDNATRKCAWPGMKMKFNKYMRYTKYQNIILFPSFQKM